MEWVLLSGVSLCYDEAAAKLTSARHLLPAPTSVCIIFTLARSTLSFPGPTVGCPLAWRGSGRGSLIVSDGRNSSTAFALSSGTIGAALAACMSRAGPLSQSESSQLPCLAISYGVVTRPVAPRLFELAHDAAVDVANRLWHDWGLEEDEIGRQKRVALYTVNVPLTDAALEPKSRTTCWADFWQNDVSLAVATDQPQTQLRACSTGVCSSQ